MLQHNCGWQRLCKPCHADIRHAAQMPSQHSTFADFSSIQEKRGLAAAKAVSPRAQQTRQERAAAHHIGAYCFLFASTQACCSISRLPRARACAYSHTCSGLVLAVLQVIPQLQGDATNQTPPDLPSYLFKERIVYLVRQILDSHCADCHSNHSWPPELARQSQ